MYVAALEQEKVFILGHTGRSGLPYDIDTVLTCAKERHKLIEINEHSLEVGDRYHGVCRTIAERCSRGGRSLSRRVPHDRGALRRARCGRGGVK